MALWVLLGLVALLEYSVGTAAITTGRIWAPWARHRVQRSKP